MFASMVIGAIPRMGKTFALRLILLAAALDFMTELHTYDLKGGADLRPLGQVSHRHRIGDEDEDLAYLAEDTEELVSEMARRYKVIRSLPERVCPEGKVTPELSARKELRLHPIVIGIDECHFAFEHATFGKKIEANITDLVKRGPAVAIHVILATQRPDAKSIPAAISSNAVLRFCLKVMGHQANDMVLGSGAYQAGIRATMFGRSERGTGYLSGESDDPQIVTFSYVDGVAAQKIAARGRALRETNGTLTGYAADLDAETETTDPAPTLLDDLAEVLTVDAPRVWSEDLLARLVELRPDTYTGWTATDLGNAASAYGVRRVQIGKRDGGKVVNRRGIDRADVLTAITLREDKARV
jgi:S-DNA-T family DNA segregation ATPase FtsK/SpoIIIE